MVQALKVATFPVNKEHKTYFSDVTGEVFGIACDGFTPLIYKGKCREGCHVFFKCPLCEEYVEAAGWEVT